MDEHSVKPTGRPWERLRSLCGALLVGSAAWLPPLAGAAEALNRLVVRSGGTVLRLFGYAVVTDGSTIYAGPVGFMLRDDRLMLASAAALIALASFRCVPNRRGVLIFSGTVLLAPLLSLWRIDGAVLVSLQSYQVGKLVLSPGWHLLTLAVMTLIAMSGQKSPTPGSEDARGAADTSSKVSA